jgi:hypothetical protein
MKRKILILMLAVMMATFLTGCGKGGQGTTASVGDFGMICDFENVKKWDTSPETGFSLKLSTEHVTEGKHSLRVIYPIDSYPSINTKKLAHDWGQYDSLTFDVFNPQDKTLSFTVRLDDENKRRVNIPMPLESGMNNVSISRQKIAKGIDAGNVWRVVLFLDNPREKVELYFDNMRLVGKKSEDRIAKTADRRPQTVDQKPPIEVIEVFETKNVTNTFPTSGIVKAYVTNLTSPKKTDVLVSTGIPFPPGVIFDERNVVISDINGNEILIASKVLARWPQDGSIRSILVQFPAKVEHKYKQVFVKWGVPRTTAGSTLVKVDWILPEGLLIMPPKWLCGSQIAGEQTPIGNSQYQKYDQNIVNNFPMLENIEWTNDPGKDGYYSTPHVFYQL